MLLSALQQRSDSVFVDLLTYSDLVSLKIRSTIEITLSHVTHFWVIVRSSLIHTAVSTLRLWNCLLLYSCLHRLS